MEKKQTREAWGHGLSYRNSGTTERMPLGGALNYVARICDSASGVLVQRCTCFHLAATSLVLIYRPSLAIPST